MFSLSSLIVRMPASLQMTDEQFFDFCQVNRDLRIERDRFGELIIMPPTGSETGNRDARIIQQLMNWTDEDGTGIAFSSSTGFTLSTGAERSPDASWIALDRWDTLSPEQQKKFAPICPDFVVELRSPSDRLETLQEKMQEYMQEPGIQLGWLIDRQNRQVYVYHPNLPKAGLNCPATVSGEPVLPGFVLDMSKIW